MYGSSALVPDYVIRGGNTYRIFADQIGSPRVVVDVSSGSVVERIDYDERGNTLKDTNPGFVPFGFAGSIVDRDTGLIRSGARDYDPSVGRWSGKDPILFASDSLNLFVYLSEDPVNGSDPSGLRGPDYIGVNINIAIPNPYTGTLVGWSGTLSVDRYGDLFASPVGVGVGKSATFVSGSLTANWLNQGCTPSPSALDNFLSSNGFGAAAGYWGGFSESYTPGAGTATGVGFVSPQAGASYNYSWKVGNLGFSW